MDWKYLPGQGPASESGDLPADRTIESYGLLLDHCSLALRAFERDRDIVWRRLDEEVAAGRLGGDEVDRLRRDHDGCFSIPLARRYLAAGKASAVTRWMRGLPSFWVYDWVDRSVHGARGRGTLRLFETLREHGGAAEGADLAGEHLWYRLVGARYHDALRQTLRSWYRHKDREQRARDVLEHRARFTHPHPVEVVFDWLEHIAATLRPFIEAGSQEAVDRLVRVENEVAQSRAKFEQDFL